MTAVIPLEEIRLNKDIKWALQTYRRLAGEGRVGQNHVRLADYKRWSYVYDIIPDGATLTDVGIGAGQFVNAAAMGRRFPSVTGIDLKKTSGLVDITGGWDLKLFSIAGEIPTGLSTDSVTCMECIEHIEDDEFEDAVRNLKDLARNQLVVTVPYEEKLPLPPYHKQRFDMERLKTLFPGGETTLISRKSRPCWAVVDWRKAHC